MIAVFDFLRLRKNRLSSKSCQMPQNTDARESNIIATTTYRACLESVSVCTTSFVTSSAVQRVM